MSSKLPVEIWQFILYSVLYTHPMFTPDPLQEYYRDQSKRIEANNTLAFQSQRSILRLVCRSWKVYVDANHVKDMYCTLFGAPVINDELVSPACAHAKRLNIYMISNRRPHQRVSERLLVPTNLIPWAPQGQSGNKLSTRVTEDMLAKAGIPSRRFKAEIIGGVNRSGCDFLSDQSLFPRLTALYINLLNEQLHFMHPPINTLLAIANLFKTLSCLYIHMGSWLLDRRDGVFELPKLTALTIINHAKIEHFAFEEWKLPSLTYLDLWSFRSANEVWQLFDALPVLGRSLRTFIVYLSIPDHNRNEDFEMSTFWSNCPVLENLEFPIVNTMHYPPPANHRLKYIKNTGRKTLAGSELDYIMGFKDHHYAYIHRFCEAAQHLQTIVDNHDWTDFSPNSRPGYILPNPEAWAKAFAAVSQDLEARGIRYEDKNGKTRIEALNDVV